MKPEISVSRRQRRRGHGVVVFEGIILLLLVFLTALPLSAEGNSTTATTSCPPNNLGLGGLRVDLRPTALLVGAKSGPDGRPTTTSSENLIVQLVEDVPASASDSGAAGSGGGFVLEQRRREELKLHNVSVAQGGLANGRLDAPRVLSSVIDSTDPGLTKHLDLWLAVNTTPCTNNLVKCIAPAAEFPAFPDTIVGVGLDGRRSVLVDKVPYTVRVCARLVPSSSSPNQGTSYRSDCVYCEDMNLLVQLKGKEVPESTKVATGAVVAAVAVAATTGIGATSVVDGQTMVVIGLVSCNGALDKKLTKAQLRSLSPVLLSEDSLGIVAGCFILLGGVGFLHFLVTCIVSCFFMRSKKLKIEKALELTQEYVRWPNLTLVLALLLNQGIAFSTFSLLFAGPSGAATPGTHNFDVPKELQFGLAFIGVLWFIILFYVLISHWRASKKKLVCLLYTIFENANPVVKFLAPSGFWRPKSETRGWGPIMGRNNRHRRHPILLLFPYWSTIIISLIAAAPSATYDACIVQHTILAIALFAVMLYFAILRPLKSPFHNFTATLSACFLTLLACSFYIVDPEVRGEYVSVLTLCEVVLCIIRVVVQCIIELVEHKVWRSKPANYVILNADGSTSTAEGTFGGAEGVAGEVAGGSGGDGLAHELLPRDSGTVQSTADRDDLDEELSEMSAMIISNGALPDVSGELGVTSKKGEVSVAAAASTTEPQEVAATATRADENRRENGTGGSIGSDLDEEVKAEPEAAPTQASNPVATEAERMSQLDRQQSAPQHLPVFNSQKQKPQGREPSESFMMRTL